MEVLIVFVLTIVYAFMSCLTAGVYHRYNILDVRSGDMELFAGVFWPLTLGGLIVVGILWYPGFLFKKFYDLVAGN